MNQQQARKHAAAQHAAAQARRAQREAAVLADVERRVAAAERGKPEGFVESSLIRDVVRTDAFQRHDRAAQSLAERAANVVARYHDKPEGGNERPAFMYLPGGGITK